MKVFTALLLLLAFTCFTCAQEDIEPEHDRDLQDTELEEYTRNLDPNNGCVKPKTRDELQGSINILLASRTPDADQPIELILCKDTNVEFEKGDPRIKILFPEGQGFTMKCKFKRTCRISGGYNGGTGRDLLGKAGFLIFESFSHRGRSISFVGIKFSGFGVMNDVRICARSSS